jgi:hypothetical protein
LNVSENRQVDDYFRRRDAVWCAAFAAAVVQVKLENMAIDEATLRARAIALAGLAVALMPGVPGEEQHGG